MRMRVGLLLLFVALTLGAVHVSAAGGSIREGECTVCVRTMNHFADLTKSLKNVDKIEDAIRKDCKTKQDANEKKFCWYIGGLPDSATSLLRTISQPLLNKVPAVKICEKLKPKDHAICELKYDSERKDQEDYTKTDFNTWKVKDLKKLLSKWGEACQGCNDKSEFVAKIKEVLPKHAPASGESKKEL